MFFLVFVLFLDCFSNMHLCAKLQPYRSKYFIFIYHIYYQSFVLFPYLAMIVIVMIVINVLRGGKSSHIIIIF